MVLAEGSPLPRAIDERPIALIVLQLASLCNLNCRYCYVPARQDPTRMDDAVLKAAIVKALRSPLVRREVEFLFHAGEPLAAGIGFFRRADDLIEANNPRGIAVTKAIQTNATLINREWCDLFIDRNYRLGVSIDGPAFLHDRNRVNWSGRGSHAQVMRGIRMLQDRGLSFGAICVLSRESLAHPDEVFAFFVDNGFQSVGFNVEEVENANTSSSMLAPDPAEQARIEQEFRAFAARLLELWDASGRRIRIREFFDMSLFMLRKRRDPSARRVPDETADTGIITISKSGEMSPYSPEFSGSPSVRYANFVVGNIVRDEYEDVLVNSVYRQIRADVHASIAACAESCAYFDLCGGAFLSNKYWQNGTLLSTETMTCRLTRQAIADTLLAAWSDPSSAEKPRLDGATPSPGLVVH